MRAQAKHLEPSRDKSSQSRSPARSPKSVQKPLGAATAPNVFSFNFSGPSADGPLVREVTDQPANPDLSTLLANLRFGDTSSGSGVKKFIGWAQASSQIRQIDQQIGLLLKSPPSAEVYALRKKRNALLSVECLPTEIFIGILRDAVRTCDSPSLELMKLSHVSWWWWSVATDSPSLWNTVKYDCPSADVALERSKTTLVDIRILANDPDSDTKLLLFVDAIEPHSSRWRSFAFDGSEAHFKIVQRLFTGPLASLGKLTISLKSQGSLDYLPMGSPLTELSLKSALLPQHVALVSSLRSLTLQNMRGDRALTASHMLALLNQCPDLETLHLKSLNPLATQVRAAQPPPSPVILSSLRRLSLTDIPEDCAATLLRTLQAPGLTRCILDLKTGLNTELFKPLFFKDPDSSSHLSLFLGKAAPPVLRISVCHHKVHATFDSGPYHLSFTVRFLTPARDVDAGLLLIRPYTHLATETHLLLNGKMKKPAQLETMPNLTKLTIGCPDTANLFVEYLRPSGVGSQVLPCPRLEHIDFVGWWDEEAVSTLTRSRNALEGGFPELKAASWRSNDPSGPGRLLCSFQHL